MAAAAAAASSAAAAVSVLHSDMPSETSAVAMKLAKEALAANKVEKDIAMHVKKAMEAYDGGMWHVVVGSSFGLSVSNENNRLLLFKVGKLHFLVFQTFDEASLVRKDGATHAHRAAQPKKAADDDEDDS